MMLNSAFVVMKKEYLQRVKSIGFWVSTILLPAFMGAMIIVPMLFMGRQKAEMKVAVVDPTGTFLPAMEQAQKERSDQLRLHKNDPAASTMDRQPEVNLVLKNAGDAREEDLRKQVLDKTLDGFLIIPRDPFKVGTIDYYARNLSNIMAYGTIESIVNRALFLLKSQTMNLTDADRSFLASRVGLKGFKIEKGGGAKEEKGVAAFFAVMIIFLSLYMMILLYGSFIMRAVLEEKTTRVVEILASSVPAFQLMMGKIIGVAFAGLTQTAVWIGCFLLLSGGGLAVASSSGLLPSLTLVQIVFFVVFFILGYLLYASLYAAVGAMFNNEQEAQQMATVVIVPVIVPVIFMQAVITSSDSTLSVVLSLIPFFTPLIMYLRILVETPPVWQVALGLALTTLTLVGVIYVSGKIYRTGILMYGKRPNLKELWRWVRA
jgi:ABC-2 type transport system permease protein